MLTADVSKLTPGAPQRLFVLEFDEEHGTVQTFGEAEVTYLPGAYNGQDWLHSGATGGEYSDAYMSTDEVQVWMAEEHTLAVFCDEASMRAGGRVIAEAWGDELPVGIHRQLMA